MEILFSEGDPDKLKSILAKDLKFRGSFFQSDSAEKYIESLISDLSKGFRYKTIKTFESGDSVCLLYEFSKPGINTKMAQLFEFSGGLISSILLIFDSGTFI